jgi:dihydroceramidase
MNSALNVPESEPFPFWGLPTSTIDWCEPNYETTRFMAEPLNTISNLSFIIFGLIGAIHESQQRSKRSYVFMHLTVTAIGLGSAAFHGTLTFLGQQMDELPMIYYLLGCAYVVNHDSFATPRLRNSMITFLVLYGIVYSAIHIATKATTVFQVHFGFLLAIILTRVAYKFRKLTLGDDVKKIVLQFVVCGLTAFGFWLLDYHGCEFLSNDKNILFNPKKMISGHVLWHILMGYAAYTSIVMLKCLQDTEKGLPFSVRYNWLLLPLSFRQVFDLEKKKSQDFIL